MPLRIGFVGAGRLAGAVAPALVSTGYSVTAVASRRRASAEALAERLMGCRATGSAQEVADAADLVFLTVPDDVIAEVAGSIRWRRGTVAVHCSGALGLDALSSASRAGAEIGSFHPLQTFAASTAPLAGVTVAIDGSDTVLATLRAVALDLGCRPIQVTGEHKTLYHVSATFASNYLLTLLQQAVRLWQPLGCSEAQALEALLPLVKTTVANAERAGFRAALTGPIARGDAGTVRRHVDALEAEAPDLVELYRELGRKTLPLARLTAVQAGELESILHVEEKQSCA